jgi:tetratricopeptide (TPR) repeat protein
LNVRLIHSGIAVAVLVASASLAHPAAAQRINCANEFRSGKLYFSQQVFDKAVDHFALAVEACPEKGEYRARYAMALAQRASELLDQSRTMASTKDEEESMKAQAMDMFKKAGAEFDSSLVRDDSKKNQKFVRENRKHYWVDHYNQGLKLANDGKFEQAAKQLEIARLVDPFEVKAYTQGAVVLIKSDHKSAAAALVQEGLKVDPENKELNGLQDSIFKDAARGLIDQISSADPEAGVAKADSAIAYLKQVQDNADEGKEDPNVYFDLGLANLEAGTAIARADTGETVSPEAKVRFVKAADEFKKAADLVPVDGENREFHLNAVFNRMQALLNAQEWEQALTQIKEYLAQEPTDGAAWQFFAQALIQTKKSEEAVLALMTYKSIEGQEISVDDAVTNAQADEKAALDQMGPPDKAYTYQDAKTGDQYNALFWFAKKQVEIFNQGRKAGELGW